jgi:phage-related protein
MIYSQRRYDVIVLEPAIVFVHTLPAKLMAKVLRGVELLERFGPYLPSPHARKLSGYGLRELRVRQGSDICRLFYFDHQGATFVITSGYRKKSNKTSTKELDRAMRLKLTYLEEQQQ